MSVVRYDKGSVSGVERLDNGFVRCSANLTRVGVFSYSTPNGTRRELRLPEEVFRKDSLKSFEHNPLTNDHPVDDLGKNIRVTSKNSKKFSVGIVNNVRRDESHVVADVLITDGDTIDQAQSGKREVSCGYNCDLEFTEGVTSGVDGVPDGQRYDAIQRNIHGNHVAIVSQGRAGRTAALHLDSDEGIMVDTESTSSTTLDNSVQGSLSFIENNTTGTTPMKKIKVDGVDFEVSEQSAQAIEKTLARADEATSKLADLEKKLTETQAKADAAQEALEASEKLNADANSPEKVQELVKSRLGLERSAQKILGETKADELGLGDLSDADIRKAVILHVSPAAADKIDGADDAYVAARFDQAVEGFKEAPAPKTELNSIRARAQLSADASDILTNADTARAEMLKRNYNLGREPIRSAK